MTRAWRIPGNAGWNELVVQPGARSHDEKVLHRIELRGRFWDARVPIAGADLVPDFAITLHQVPIDDAPLGRLHAALVGWLADTTALFSVPLADGREHRFELALEGSEGHQSHTHPMLAVRYSGPRLPEVECRFRIDPTCVWDAIEALARPAC